MTHIAVLGRTNMDLVAYVEKGASASMPSRQEIEAGFTS